MSYSYSNTVTVSGFWTIATSLYTDLQVSWLYCALLYGNGCFWVCAGCLSCSNSLAMWCRSCTTIILMVAFDVGRRWIFTSSWTMHVWWCTANISLFCYISPPAYATILSLVPCAQSCFRVYITIRRLDHFTTNLSRKPDCTCTVSHQHRSTW